MFRSAIPSSILRNKGWTRLFVTPHRLCSNENENIDEWISSLPKDEQERVRIIQNEIASRCEMKTKMPQVAALSIVDYKNMLQMSNSNRQRFYGFLFKSQMSEANDELRKLIRQKVLEQKKQMNLVRPSNEHIEYGLSKNTLMLKLRSKTINQWLNQKLSCAMMLDDPPLLFDCGFNHTMTKQETKSCAKQLGYSFKQNRLHKRPFVIHLCNIDKDSALWTELVKAMPNIEKNFVKIHSGDILDVFPKEKLVYLSPNAEKTLKTFNSDDRYVVGAIVDKGNRKPLTLDKAGQLGIRSARLPLEEYVKFTSHKTLTLDQMTNILLELKTSQCWTEAFKSLPTRKIESSDKIESNSDNTEFVIN